jgi:hypothetical protein
VVITLHQGRELEPICVFLDSVPNQIVFFNVPLLRSVFGQIN